MEYFETNKNLIERYIPNYFTNKTKKRDENGNIQVNCIEDIKNIHIERNNVKCYLNSLYSTDNEMKNTFKNISKDTKVLILFGVGYGYCIEYIQKNFDSLKHLIIIEPCNDVFQNMISVTDMSKLNRIELLTLLVGLSIDKTISELTDALVQNDCIFFEIAYNLNYKTSFEDYYLGIDKYLVKFLLNCRIGLFASLGNVFNWNFNTIMNIPCESIFFSDIKKMFKEKTIIIVSAGPSLNKNIHLLKNIKNEAIIVAAGTGIRILNENDIKPHFRIAVDGKDIEYNIFKDLKDTEIPLIYTSFLNVKSREKCTGPKLELVLEEFCLSEYIYEKCNYKYQFSRSSISCANIALNIFCEAGCERIIFMGQDVAFSDGVKYAKGSNNQQSLELNEMHVLTKDIYGQDVYSDKNFLFIKNEIETVIAAYPKIEFINATEGGLFIKGAIHKKFKNVLIEELRKTQKLDDNYIEFLNNFPNQKNSKLINEAIRDIECKYEELIIFCETIIEDLDNGNDDIVNEAEYLRGLDITYSKYLNLRETDFYKQIVKKDLLFVTRGIESKYRFVNFSEDYLSLRQYLIVNINILYEYSVKMKKIFNITQDIKGND